MSVAYGRTGPTSAVGGMCPLCGRRHGIGTGKAYQACLRLMELLSTLQRIDYTVPVRRSDPRCQTDYLFGPARGKMFGALVGIDRRGRERRYYAFSGQYNSMWTVAGWVAPVVEPWAFAATVAEGERQVKQLTREINEFSHRNGEHVRVLKHRRRHLSQQLMRDIHRLYSFTNFRGVSGGLSDVYMGNGSPPTGTGDCCAPKLLHHAAINGVRPLGLAEFFWGRENASGSRQHGVFYPPCATKCEPILGFLLCGAGE